MYTRKFIRTGLLLRFSWRDLLGFTALAAAACVMYDVLGWKEVAIPFLPLGVIGTAVAFYVGFKNNSSYERLWEARRLVPRSADDPGGEESPDYSGSGPPVRPGERVSNKGSRVTLWV